MIYFTSDTHFGHANILVHYPLRPGTTVKEHDAELVRRWNARVGPEDTVYHLGDFALGPRTHAATILRQLRGNIVLVKGNHDRSVSACLSQGFPVVHKELFLELDNVPLYLHHQPMPSEHWQHRARVHLCGHVHREWAFQATEGGPIIINVGADVRDFEPKTLAELLQSISA